MVQAFDISQLTVRRCSPPQQKTSRANPSRLTLPQGHSFHSSQKHRHISQAPDTPQVTPAAAVSLCQSIPLNCFGLCQYTTSSALTGIQLPEDPACCSSNKKPFHHLSSSQRQSYRTLHNCASTLPAY